MRQFRRSSRSLSLSGYFPPGVKWLIIVNVAVYVLIGLFGRPIQNDLLILHLIPVTVVHNFTLYQLVTYLFLHASISHLVFNMLALWMFGLPLEQTWGTRRFLKFYFLCGIGAGICDVAFHAELGQWGTNTIGASQATFDLQMAFAGNDGISNIAHLGGMAFGYVYLKGRLPSMRLGKRMPDLGDAFRQ